MQPNSQLELVLIQALGLSFIVSTITLAAGLSKSGAFEAS